MLAANPHIGQEHEARVIEYGAFTFLHAVQLGGKICILTDMEARDAFVAIRVVVMRGRVVPFLYVKERIIHR